MNTDLEVSAASTQPTSWKRSVVILGVIVAGFLILRVPLMSRQQGGTDEAFFAVPGKTILQEGIPRIPYLPVRDKTSVFYQADKVLFCLPPAYFYWQAVFFGLLPDSFLTARLASATSGLLMLGILYLLGRQFLGSDNAGLWAAGLFSLSRLFYFPATSTRPDMLCGMWGLAAVMAAWKWSRDRDQKSLAGTGVLLGLGLLTHPYAIVYCLQIGLWVLLAKQTWRRRLQDTLFLVTCTVATFLLWVPLILLDPEVFWLQFSNNVLERAGPGLLARCLMPWQSLTHHFQLLVEHAQIPQLVLLLGGLTTATLLAIRHRQRSLTTLVLLTWTSIYLLVTISGVHPVKGYWCYPGGLLFLCTGYSISCFLRTASWPASSLATTGTTILLALLLMAPGLGLRTWLSNITNWSNAAYNQPALIRQVLQQLPSDSRLYVDPAFVFDAYLTGAQVTFGSLTDIPVPTKNQAAKNQATLSETPTPAGLAYDYLVVGPLGRQQNVAKQFQGQLVDTFGSPQDPFACFIQLYRVPRQAD